MVVVSNQKTKISKLPKSSATNKREREREKEAKMASILPPELDNDSLASSPRSEYDNQPRVRFMCTFGGRILPRPPDNQLCYVGGDNRMVAVHRHTTFASLLSKLAKLSGKQKSNFIRFES